MGLERKLSIAIIGSGFMAREHIKVFNSIENVIITGIFSRTYEKISPLVTEYNIPFICHSIPELYEKTQADLVVVAVSEAALPQLVDEIFEFPWVSLMEKPVGLSFQASRAIYDKMIASGSRVLVALNRRFYSASQQVLSDLNQNNSKRYIQVLDYECLDIARSFNPPAEVITGWMYANSIHLIDYFSFLGRGEITKVHVVQPWDPKFCQPVIAHIHYDSGDEGHYTGIWHGPGPWSVSVVTQEKYYEMKPLETANFRTRQERTPMHFSICPADIEYKPGLKKQAEHAIAYLQNQENQSVTLENSLKTMRLIQQIYGQ